LFCKKCGCENKDMDKFCQKCGADLASSLKAENTKAFDAIIEEYEEAKVDAEEVPEGGAVLIVKKGPMVGQKFLLNKDKITIGRNLGSDIFLDDITVSRGHAEIDFDLKGAILKDLGSLNGTYVNNKLVEKAKLKNKDEIQIGRFKLVFLNKQS